MGFEEIKAGLENYTKQVEEKLKGIKELPTSISTIYYVKSEYNEMIGARHWVYAHYPTTQPDTPYMIFRFKENAELFCKVLNAENANVPYSIAFGGYR